jgi:inorganic pyrophosphatase
MDLKNNEPLWELMGVLFKSHPWHGVRIGDDSPQKLTAYIESVPTDTVKYEIDKVTGHLMIDRPQKYSNVCPALYGLVPQTYCADRVAKLCSDSLGRGPVVGDHDPVDICVLTEKSITHGDILVNAIPIGGLRMLDGAEADDKIVAVLEKDATYGHLTDISEVPTPIIDRLHHYFETYKQGPGEPAECEIAEIYGREAAYDVIRASREDYDERFAGLYDMLSRALSGHR